MSKDKNPFRFLYLLGVIILGALGFMFVGRLEKGTTPATRSRDHLPREEAFLLIGEHKHIIRDNDGDGRADCLIRVGLGSVIGTVYQADGASCSKVLRSVAPMSEELRSALSALLEQKNRGSLGEVSPRDDDGDGTADCLVSVHNSKVAAANIVMKHEDEARALVKNGPAA